MINKRKLAKRVSRKSLFTIEESRRLIDLVFEEILQAAMEGEEVNISKFGKFFKYVQKSRQLMDINSMKLMILEEKNILKFKSSTHIKNKMNSE